MALITLEEAMARHEVPRPVLEEWIRLGILPLAITGDGVEPALIDEEILAEVVEREGWFQISSEHWDGDEDA